MKKAFAFAVIVILLTLALVGTALAIIGEIGGGSPPVKKELAVIEGDDLIIYVREDWISDVPKGVPADTALALYRGKLPHYTAIDKDETRIIFSLPIKKWNVKSFRVVSYQQGWREEPGLDSSINNGSFVFTGFFTFIAFVIPFFATLHVSLEQKRKRKLFLFYLMIFVSVVPASYLSFSIGGFFGLMIGVVVSFIGGIILGSSTAKLAGTITVGLWSVCAVFFASRLTIGWTDWATDWLRANYQYLVFIIACCLLSYLTTLIVRKISIRMEVAKHKRVMGQP